MKHTIRISDDIKEDIIKHRGDKTSIDPITMVIVSVFIQYLITNVLTPYINKKCSARHEEIISGSQKPGLFYRWIMHRAIKQTLKAPEFAKENLSTAGITRYEVSSAVFRKIASLSVEEFDVILRER